MSNTTTFQTLLDEDILEIGDGYRAKNSELTGGGEIFLRAGHVSDTHIDFEGVERFAPELTGRFGSKLSRTGDTIITTKGNSTGRTSFVTAEMPRFVYSPHLCYWRSADPERIENGFLRYWAQGTEFQTQLAALKTATDMAPYLSLTDQRRLKITLPRIEDQRAIASILGALDDKIELNRRMNATLESLARAIFKSWFVDFDPVKINAGQLPASSHAPEFLVLFPSIFQDSGIPQGWQLKALGDVIEIHDSKRIPLSKKQRAERQGTYPYYGAASVMDYVDDYLFEGVHVLMGEDGSVVNNDGTPVLQYVWGQFWVNNHAHVLKGTNGISDEHLLLHLQHASVKPFVTGAVQPKINQGNLKRIPFLLPTPEVADAFSQTLGPLFKQIRANSEESETLTLKRDVLLPSLLSGDLAVDSVLEQEQ